MSASSVAPPGKNGASAFGPSLFSKPATQPKAAPTSNGGGAPPFTLAPTPTYAQGYQSPAMKGAASHGTAVSPPFSPLQVQTPQGLLLLAVASGAPRTKRRRSVQPSPMGPDCAFRALHTDC